MVRNAKTKFDQGVILSLLGKGEGSAQWVLIIAKVFVYD